MNLKSTMMVMLFSFLFYNGFGGVEQIKNKNFADLVSAKIDSNMIKLDTATLGAGCFWCIEAIFQQLKGVEYVASGYSGGHVINPSYREVCNETTGHAEVIQVRYDSSVISYAELLEVFWKIHDPTMLNRQGADIGTQYRSAIFYHNDDQKKVAEELMIKLDKARVYRNPIVTEITEFTCFYKAEEKHDDYYNQNKNQGYCRVVITPKIEKFKKVFKSKIKD